MLLLLYTYPYTSWCYVYLYHIQIKFQYTNLIYSDQYIQLNRIELRVFFHFLTLFSVAIWLMSMHDRFWSINNVNTWIYYEFILTGVQCDTFGTAITHTSVQLKYWYRTSNFWINKTVRINVYIFPSNPYKMNSLRTLARIEIIFVGWIT